METELTRRILRSVPLLAHLTEVERDQVIEKFVEKKYQPQEFILRQGESGDQGQGGGNIPVLYQEFCHVRLTGRACARSAR